MTFEDLAVRIGADPADTNLRAHWEAVVTRLHPARYAAEFLTPEAVRRHATLASLPPQSVAELLDEADRVRNDETLLALAALLHRVFFDDATGPGLSPIPFPASLPDDAARGTFSLLVALGYPDTYARLNRARGIPEDVIHDTVGQLACYDVSFRRAFGRAGIRPTQLARAHASLPPRHFFRLGRFEFIQTKFARNVVVYRERGGAVVAFSTAGQPFLPDGRLCATDRPLPADARLTTLVEDGARVAGHSIGADTRLSPEPQALPSGDWECALRPGDPVIEMHIPTGGGMTPERTDDSLRRVFPFFDRHFPGNGLKAITCHSWILSTQLRECLPPESNILALQSRVHLLPIAPNAGCDAGLRFLFVNPPPYDLAALPRDTSMRRAVAGWLEKGETFCVGAMFLLRQELPGS